MKTKILIILSVLTIFTACEREDIYDFMEGHTRPLTPEIKITRSSSALFNNDAFTVTMRAKTGAIIEYTINGADPTPGGGTVYSGPFIISAGGNNLIKAIGHIDLDVSGVSSTTVTVGDGTTISYEIATAAQLNNIRAPYLVDTFVQTANIDLSAYSSGEGWMPIGNDTERFVGSFNGNGYKITGLKINKPTVSDIGLFGVVGDITSATLTNIALQGVNITGDSNVGGIVGRATGSSTISNCYSTGSISGNGMFGGLVGNLFESDISGSYSTCIVSGGGNAGGLVGFMFDSTVSQSYATGNVSAAGLGAGGLTSETGGAAGSITESYSTGKVTGVDNTGGLVGRVSLSTINRCYATGEVFATGIATGGLVGEMDNAGSNINESYSTGKVTGLVPVGGLLGSLVGGSVTKSVWNKVTSNQTDSAGLMTTDGKMTVEMKTQTTFTTDPPMMMWDFSTIWTIQEGVSYPYFQWQGSANIPK